MGTSAGLAAPAIPTAPKEYSAQYMNVAHNTQRVFFQAVTNALTTAAPHECHYSLTTQTNPVASTPNTAAFEVESLSTSTSLTQTYTKLATQVAGTYLVEFSTVTVNSGASGTVYLWLRKNGVDIADSVICATHSGSSAKLCLTTASLVKLGDLDYIQCMWASDSTNTSLTTVAASGSLPAVPSCKVKLEWVTHLDLR